MAMLPEDLVPTATTPIWGCINRVDWTATPMLAIQELVQCPRTDAGLDIASGGRLEDILSPPEITSLLEIFETRYTPWLCAQPGSLECSNSLLDIVRCTIASQHLAPGTRSVIAPRLQKLTEDVFLREIFNPQPALESIKALLILSVWAPICGTGAEARDGRLLIASAVSMAMNLHLQNESKRAIGLRADKDGLTPAKQAELDDSTQRCQCTPFPASPIFSLIPFVRLCIGTGRAPVSHISRLDKDMASLATLPNFTLPAIRDIRLGLSVKMFQMTEIALKTRLKSVVDLNAFFHTVNGSNYSMESLLGRLLTPLPVVTQHDSFYSQMLLLQYHSCRLLMLHHALRETRTVHEKETPLDPWWKVTTEGQRLSLFWGRTAIISAEAVLSAFLAQSDLTLMSSAPDNVYVMVGFAATWMFVSNFSIHQLSGSKMGGASERLQAITIDRLNQIAHAPDHSAARCGHVLAALLRAWERRQNRSNETDAYHWHSQYYTMDMPYEWPSSVSCEPRYDNSTDYLNAPDYTYPEVAEVADANFDLFMDDAFWTSFIENLNSDTFIAQNSAMM
ncbi:hypothetical protein DFH09DRAFT_1138290 [Mycena vulgaris]|nr:hypothetical protein DFH09DRAFT_1138290 [Mycena vulgaris]